MLGFRINKGRRPCRQRPCWADRAWEQVAADVFEWQGGHYLVVVDYYSRFPEVRKLSGLGSRQVTAALQLIFACHGLPNELISDNGPQFFVPNFLNGLRSMVSSILYIIASVPSGEWISRTLCTNHQGIDEEGGVFQGGI